MTLVRAASLASRLRHTAAWKRPVQVVLQHVTAPKRPMQLILLAHGVSYSKNRNLPLAACDGVDSKQPVADPSPASSVSTEQPSVITSLLIAVGEIVVAVLFLPYVLASIGFGFIGIIAGSLAASFQSCFGTPWMFRCLQSTAMLGVPLPARVCGGVAAVGGVKSASRIVSNVWGSVTGFFCPPDDYVEQWPSSSEHQTPVLETEKPATPYTAWDYAKGACRIVPNVWGSVTGFFCLPDDYVEVEQWPSSSEHQTPVLETEKPATPYTAWDCAKGECRIVPNASGSVTVVFCLPDDYKEVNPMSQSEVLE